MKDLHHQKYTKILGLENIPKYWDWKIRVCVKTSVPFHSLQEIRESQQNVKNDATKLNLDFIFFYLILLDENLNCKGEPNLSCSTASIFSI